MTNLKRGKLYITKEDILSYMGLSNDTHLEFVPNADGVEINVFASSKNDHECLVDNTSEMNNWNIARVRIPIVDAKKVVEINKMYNNI